MVLKIKYGDGRTNYTVIGNDFMYTEFFGDGFENLCKGMGLNEQSKKDCMGIIHDGKGLQVPIYKQFPTQICSNDGQTFATLL